MLQPFSCPPADPSRAARAKPREVQPREREVGERQAVPQRSRRFRLISNAITIFLMIAVNLALLLFLKSKFGNIFG